MTRTLVTLTLVAAAALAGCDNKGTTIVQEGPKDPMANQLANAAPVELPPAITATKAYRCKDNSLIYVDWLSDGTSRVKKDRNDVGTAPAEGALTGDSKASSITYNGKSCKA